MARGRLEARETDCKAYSLTHSALLPDRKLDTVILSGFWWSRRLMPAVRLLPL